MSFQIGSLAIQPHAGFDINQQYEQIGPESIRRSVSGRAIKQQTYEKLRVVTSGSGWVPAGIETVDCSAVHIVRCVVLRAVHADFSTRQAVLPAARRSDAEYTPVGYAYLTGPRVVSSPVSLVGNVATVAAVAGATGYSVGYFPQISCFIKRPTISGDVSSATLSWEVVAEEV